MTQKHIPVAVGLLLCDQVIVAEKTQDITPVNCFAVRRVRRFPSPPFSFTIFALLTDGAGEILLDVVIQRLDNLEEVHRRSYKGFFPHRLKEMQFTLNVRSCSFPAPGHYQVSLFAEGELLAQRKLKIELKD